MGSIKEGVRRGLRHGVQEARLTWLGVRRRHHCGCAASGPHQPCTPSQSTHAPVSGNSQTGSPGRGVLHWSLLPRSASHTSGWAGWGQGSESTVAPYSQLSHSLESSSIGYLLKASYACATLGKLLNISEPWQPHLLNRHLESTCHPSNSPPTSLWGDGRGGLIGIFFKICFY